MLNWSRLKGEGEERAKSDTHLTWLFSRSSYFSAANFSLCSTQRWKQLYNCRSDSLPIVFVENFEFVNISINLHQLSTKPKFNWAATPCIFIVFDTSWVEVPYLLQLGDKFHSIRAVLATSTSWIFKRTSFDRWSPFSHTTGFRAQIHLANLFYRPSNRRFNNHVSRCWQTNVFAVDQNENSRKRS